MVISSNHKSHTWETAIHTMRKILGLTALKSTHFGTPLPGRQRMLRVSRSPGP